MIQDLIDRYTNYLNYNKQARNLASDDITRAIASTKIIAYQQIINDLKQLL